MSSRYYVVALNIAGLCFVNYERHYPRFPRQVLADWNNFQQTDVYQRKTQHLGFLCH